MLAKKKDSKKTKSQPKPKNRIKQYKKECFRNVLSCLGNILFLLSLGYVGYICKIFWIMCGMIVLPMIIMVTMFMNHWKEYYRLCTSYYEKDFKYRCMECGEEYTVPFKYLKQTTQKLQKNKQGQRYCICDFCGRHIHVSYQNKLEKYEYYQNRIKN